MDNMTDEKLVELYLNGDEKSMELLVKRYLPQIYGFAKRYAGRPEDASDITQEVFVKVWKNIKQFHIERSFRSWIFTIAKRSAIDWLKRKSALPFSILETGEGREDFDFADNLIDESISVVDKMSDNDDYRQISWAMSKLSPDHAAVINLHLKEELTFNEIANILSKPINTVKSQYRRGIAALKKIISLDN